MICRTMSRQAGRFRSICRVQPSPDDFYFRRAVASLISFKEISSSSDGTLFSPVTWLNSVESSTDLPFFINSPSKIGFYLGKNAPKLDLGSFWPEFSVDFRSSCLTPQPLGKHFYLHFSDIRESVRVPPYNPQKYTDSFYSVLNLAICKSTGTHDRRMGEGPVRGRNFCY